MPKFCIFPGGETRDTVRRLGTERGTHIDNGDGSQ